MRRTLANTTLISSASLALVTMIAACNGAEDTAPPRAEAEAEDARPAGGEAPKPEPTADVDEVQDEPGRFYGRTVTLSGEIENVRSNTAFELEGDDWLFPDELLVLTKSPVRLGAEDELDDLDVIITGKIVPMVVADVERELGWDLEPQLEMEFQSKPVLIAESIRAVDEVARWSETEAREGEIVSMWMLYSMPTPEALAGRRIDLESVTVQSKTGDAVWVGETHGAQILVAPGRGTDLSQLRVGDEVALTGTLQRMPAAEEALSRWKIDPSLRQQVEEEMLFIDAESVKAATDQPQAAGEPITLAAFGKAPGDNVGKTVQGEATVGKVISDRAFWVNTDARSGPVLMIVREDVPEHNMIEIEAGQRIRFTAQSHGPQDAQALGGTLEDDAKQAIESMPGFLAAHHRDVEILDEATDQPKG